MKHFNTLCLALAAALLLVDECAQAQMYAWKDPNSGQSKFSNIAPPWYSRGEQVSGPRVIQTLGGRVVDDTALPYENRLLISGKSQDYVDKLRSEKSQAVRPPGEPVHESASGATLKRKKG